MISGIYKITNLMNNKFYIGSARNIIKRWHEHICRLDKGGHPNIHLQSAWYKYGNFNFTVIEECDVESLIEREQYYLDNFKPNYNIGKTAGNSLGVKHSPESRARMSIIMTGNINALGYKHTPEAHDKMHIAQLGNQKGRGHRSTPEQIVQLIARNKSRIYTPETRAQMSAVRRGIKASPETRAKMSASRKGKRFTPEHSAKISAALKGRVFSPETRAKMSASGKVKVFTSEHRVNMSVAQRHRYQIVDCEKG